MYTKKEFEEQMYYIIGQNIELERIIRQAEEAREKIRKNEEKMIELAKMYIERGIYND
jgi:predicted ATP-grasp superfamily ATP-dependent carboligase